MQGQTAHFEHGDLIAGNLLLHTDDVDKVGQLDLALSCMRECDGARNGAFALPFQAFVSPIARSSDDLPTPFRPMRP